MYWTRLSVLLVCAAFSAHAQESEDLEEVTVRAAQPLGVLRAEAAEAEQALYEAFNGVLDERAYEIECRRYTATGSRVSRRVCEPAYVRILQSKATWRALTLAGFDSDRGDLDLAVVRVTGNASSEIIREDRILLDKMVAAVNENAEVQEALIDYLQKQQAVVAATDEGAPRD